MPSLTFLLPVLAQLGGGIGTAPASSLPLEIIEKKEDEARRAAAAGPGYTAPTSNPGGCIGAVEADPERSARLAQEALDQAVGREKLRAGLCLGIALSDLGQFDEARDAFVTARDAAESDDHASRARLGAMAGNAQLASGDAARALLLLGPAAGESKLTEDKALQASIALDRARALVALDQGDEAAKALAEAREAAPEDAQAWLLSATLSRRQDKLIEAQSQIDKAAQLAPRDPAVGLEAGVIAMLSDNEEAARRSWNSVIAVAPESPEAGVARGYIAQLGADASAP
ncbi:hypothetical protein I5E68_19175 [Novosphingobium sp. YJ-S2-02]|uniref:Tetratricopeptide repeat protein n=1 Tax=Novosphingobium aureum TaxID=2792964 RepID=A0A931HFB3_9SPHN|nr:hypothetical protein [Novosphingobium aureum]MBH0115070.1 hypothetical protein [Novosphingobium aureum]